MPSKITAVLGDAQKLVRSQRLCQGYRQEAFLQISLSCMNAHGTLPGAPPRRLKTDPKMDIPDSSERNHLSMKLSADEQEIH